MISSVAILSQVTLFSVGIALLIRWRMKKLFFQAHLVENTFLACAALMLTWQSIAGDRFLPGTLSIEKQPGLLPYHLILYGLLIGYLYLMDILPKAYQVLPTYWPVFFLFSSNLYLTNFFATEYGAAYLVIYALAIWVVVSVWMNRKNNGFSQVFSTLVFVQIPFGLLLLALTLSTYFSNSVGESLDKLSQIACFGLLPFLMAVTLKDRKAWMAAAVLLAGGAGLPWLWLGAVKFLQLASQFGWQMAAGYRLYLSGVGPNWVAYILVTILPLTLGIGMAGKRLVIRIFFLVIFTGLLVLLAYTQARQGFSGWFGLITAAIVAAGLYLALQRRFYFRILWVLVPVGLMAIAVIILFGIPLLQKVNPPSLYTRMFEWQALFQSIVDNPIAGTGLGVRYTAAHFGNLVSWSQTGATLSWLANEWQSMILKQLQLTYHTHNLFLEVAVGSGLPSLALFIWYLFTLARHGWKTFREANQRDRLLIAGCIAGIAGSIGWGLIDVMDYSPIFLTFPVWALIGLLFAAPNALRDADPG